MDYIQVVNNETEHTSKQSSVYVEKNKVYQITDSYRNLISSEQLMHVIESLTLEKGYIMDSHHNNLITFKNPMNSETLYWVWTDLNAINKRTIKCIGEIQV